MKLVKYPHFQKLLIRYSNLDRVSLRASFLEPRRYQWDIVASTSRSSPLVEGFRSPIKIDCTHSLLIIQRLFIQNWLNCLRKGKFLKIFISHLKIVCKASQFLGFICRDRVYNLIKIKSFDLRIIILNINYSGMMIWRQFDFSRS